MSGKKRPKSKFAKLQENSPKKIVTKPEVKPPPVKETEAKTIQQDKEKKRFYERGAWPGINFLGLLLLLGYNLTNGGITLYDKWRGSEFNFQFRAAEYNVLGNPAAPSQTFFLIRGDVFNEGKSPLRVREFDLDVKFNNRWIPLRRMNMPDSIILEPNFMDDFNHKIIYRKNLRWLDEIGQIKGEESINGLLYGVIDSSDVSPFVVMSTGHMQFRIHCVKIDLSHETVYFDSFREPRNAHQRIDAY